VFILRRLMGHGQAASRSRYAPRRPFDASRGEITATRPGHGGHALDLALAEFAEIYADQNQRDYDTLEKAADSGGRINATPGL
jgi:hypothetical protein